MRQALRPICLAWLLCGVWATAGCGLSFNVDLPSTNELEDGADRDTDDEGWSGDGDLGIGPPAGTGGTPNQFPSETKEPGAGGSSEKACFLHGGAAGAPTSVEGSCDSQSR